MSEPLTRPRRLTIGVCGGVAAYKAAELTRLFVKAGYQVSTVLTRGATRFVNPLLFEALSGQPAHVDGGDNQRSGSAYAHLRLGQETDAVLIAPATANLIGKAANGIGDDELSTMLLAATAPVVVAPAMNSAMWANPLVQLNLSRLRDVGGFIIVEPGAGELACGAQGMGRLAELDAIVAETRRAAERGPLDGRSVLITAGPTREALDPIRFISNRSTGVMGYALAAASYRLGATVTLVAGPNSLLPPHGVRVLPVETAAEMHAAVSTYIGDAEIAIFAAAVADYRPRTEATQKIKKDRGALSVEWERTTDILKTMAVAHPQTLMVGFCAETDDLLENAKRKLNDKGCEIIVANQVGRDRGFGAVDSSCFVLDRWGGSVALGPATKDTLATEILELIGRRYQSYGEAIRQ